MPSQTPIPNFLESLKVIRHETAQMAGIEGIKFFKESFVKQGFTDTSIQKWDKSKTPLSGKRTLYKSGNLMRSFKKQVSKDRVIVENYANYADIHNNGGFVTVTIAWQKHWWKKYYEFANNKNQRAKSKKADFCKAMALLPLGSKIKIPKRQFMGNSKALMNILNKKAIDLKKTEMIKAFKSIRF